MKSPKVPLSGSGGASRIKGRHRRSYSIAMVLYVGYVILDALILTGISEAPSATGHVVCAARVFGEISALLFPKDLLDAAEHFCTGTGAIEPAVSIIWFITKVSIAVMCIPALAFFVATNRSVMQDLRQDIFKTLEDHTYWKELRKDAFSFCFMIFMTAELWWMNSFGLTNNFNTHFVHKLSYEDFFCLSLLILGPMTLIIFFSAVVFPLQFRLRTQRKTE